jgi:glycosyltransferase involved in cell wall biosynthesis
LCLPIDLKIGGFAAKIAGIRNIIYRRGSAIPIKNSFSNRFIFRFIINNIIANSVATKATILQNNKNLFCPDKIKVLYNGIEIINYYNKRIQNEIVIGTAGRLEKQKNHEALIRIAKILEDNEINYSIKIAGEGSCKQLLESEIKRSGMSDKVELCGFKQDIHEFLNELDVFVLPSKWEGFGYVLAEAMMHRLPIVTFDISSNPELVINNDNGFLVQPFDEQAFADKLVILSTNHKLREKMGQRGYERVITKFDKEENLKLTETYLLSL